MRFRFGEYEDGVILEAKNLEHATKIYKVSELFPEKQVDPVYRKKDEEGYSLSEYDSALGRYHYVWRTPNPKISIFEDVGDHEWKKIGSIGLNECVDVDYRDLMPRVNLLEAPKVMVDDSEEEKETLPIVVDKKAIAQVTQKPVLRKKHDEIARQKAKLELMVLEMDQAMKVLQDELSQKQKMVYIIETFLGTHEEVVQIAEGEPAPEGSRLTLYQQKLYMDEEVGIWDDDDGQGLDFKNIEQFDEWIVKHYKTFAYEPLSVVVWQVRRKEKNYGCVWENVQFNNWNKATYFLIRNGEQLYRIWSNVSVSDRLFPTKDEYQKLIQEEMRWGADKAKEKLQRKHETYLYGLIAIQGVIERTDILGTTLRREGVNLMSPRGNMDEYVRFVRDAEPEFWLGDGRPRWRDFLKANRETVCLGSRVCLSTEKYYFKMYSDKGDDDRWRSQPFRPNHPPQRDCCYSVEAYDGESKDQYFPHSTTILIRYLPDDNVGWDPYTYQEIKRKRRVPWFLYSDEVLNFDEITLEEADYYMKSRLDRSSYVSMLPTLHWVRRVKKREQELEDEFAKMIAGQLNMEITDPNREKIQEAIDWWKKKNKWKRAVTTKESTATRMILKRLS